MSEIARYLKEEAARQQRAVEKRKLAIRNALDSLTSEQRKKIFEKEKESRSG